MEKKNSLYGLYVENKYIDSQGDENFDFIHNASTTLCLCVSYDESLLIRYKDVFQEASDIKFKLRPTNTLREIYSVAEIVLV